MKQITLISVFWKKQVCPEIDILLNESSLWHSYESYDTYKTKTVSNDNWKLCNALVQNELLKQVEKTVI